MNTLKRQQLESLGYTVFEKWANGRLRTFVTHPDGHTLAWFDHLTLIQPGDLYDGEQFDLAWEALPSEVRYKGIGADVYEYIPETGLPAEYSYDPETGELLPWWAICLIIYAISILVGVMFTMITNLVQKINAPCGIAGDVQEINTCWTMVIAPDCSKRLFNACAGPDNNGDGYPDGEWEGDWTKDVWDPTEVIKWAVIGVVAVAGTLLVYSFLKPKPYYPPPQYYPPPPPEADSYSYA